MAASEADTPTNPEAQIRASDSERDDAARELGDRFAEGRLSQETFMRRMDDVFGARNRDQLDGVFTDLPRPGPARTVYVADCHKRRGDAPTAAGGGSVVSTTRLPDRQRVG